MKEIIYLDTGVLHSFLAQNNDGLPMESSNERSEEVTDSTKNEKGYNSRSYVDAKLKTGNVNIPFIFQTPEGEFRARLQPGPFATEGTVMSQTETGKEIISKQLHDNALVQFEKYLTESGEIHDLSEENLEGKFIKCTTDFKIIDFKYLQKIMQTDKLIEFMFTKDQEQLDSLKTEIDKIKDKTKSLQTARFQSEKSRLDKQKKTMKDQFSFLEKSLEYLNDILPTDAFIIIGNTIAPLKNEYLREKAKELTFKYGGAKSNLKITMVGKVTSKVDSVETPDFNGANAFFEFPKLLSTVLHPLGVINEGDLIVSPIAIYFE